MADRNLEELLGTAESPVALLRNAQVGPNVYPGVPAEYTNWRDEQRAWQETCVLYNQNTKEITVFYEELSTVVAPADIRRNLATVFPKYMITTAFHPMASLPRNPNGKVDRNRLTKLLSESR